VFVTHIKLNLQKYSVSSSSNSNCLNETAVAIMSSELALEEILQRYIPEKELAEVKCILYGRNFK